MLAVGPWRQQQQQAEKCYRCGGNHRATGCRFRTADCHNCGKKGHLARVCRSKTKNPLKTQHHLDEELQCSQSQEEQDDAAYTLFNLPGGPKPKPFWVTVKINEVELPMEVDTGAAVSIVSVSTYNRLWSGQSLPLQATATSLRTYTGEKIDVRGSAAVCVEYLDQKEQLELLVVAGMGPSLLGRDWLLKLRLDWSSINKLQGEPTSEVQVILDRHTEVFKDELGLLKTMSAKIQVDPQAQPRFCKPRPVPYALRDKVNEEIERLEKAGIIEPVQHAEWAAPIVPVVKQDGTIRICGDYKMTVNQAAKQDIYPLPRVDDLLASLAGGKHFTKLDLAHAYLQVPLDEESRQFVTVNTEKGLYQYTRLPFGVSSAPSIFQRTMERLLHGIPNVLVYIDDVLIKGVTREEHLRAVEEVLARLEQAGLKLKRSKCFFMLPSVEYLGHEVSAEGLRPTKEKVRAVVEAPAPLNVMQLRSFLGLVNYYSKFLPQLASTLAPLHRLLQKNTQWRWGNAEMEAFNKAKEELASPRLLTHFDPRRPLLLSCDASPYGIGAVLSHSFEDGSEKPVAYASRSLAPAERNYAQIEREGLSIVFGVKKFHQFLFGHKFTIFSDHKPLQHILSASRMVPTMASARLQRWALTLSAYNYEVRYKKGAEHSNADAFSRLPLPEAPRDVPVPGDTVLMFETLQKSPTTATQIKEWTNRDPMLSQVRDMLLLGWEDLDIEGFQPFKTRKDELTVQDGCVLWGNRVVIPHKGRDLVLEGLHDGHPGVSRMKAIARGIVWWPGIDADVERKVKSCPSCLQNQKMPPLAPLHPWSWPSRPWERIHVDYAGPFLDRMFLIVVDAYSKWLEVVPVSSATSSSTIQALMKMFATHGLPKLLVSDNGAVFTSVEFHDFLNRNGVRQMTTAPYHPSSNGLAERAVQTFKAGMKRNSQGNVETRLASFLFHYRTTPHTTTGVSPAELLMGRCLRRHLDLLRPDIGNRVLSNQARQKVNHDRNSPARQFALDDKVMARNYAGGVKWLPGVISSRLGELHFEVQLEDGRYVRRHIDQIRGREVEPDNMPGEQLAEEPDFDDFPETPLETPEAPQHLPEDGPPQLRRSARNRQPPDRSWM